MRFLTLGEVIDLHRAIIAQSGGSAGIRDLRLLDSALAQPKATFSGQDLHPTLTDKAVDEEEEIILQVAQGRLDRRFMAEWLLSHTVSEPE